MAWLEKVNKTSWGWTGPSSAPTGTGIYFNKGLLHFIDDYKLLITEPNKSVTDMKKVKKFPLAEFLGFIISAKKCVILDMSKAMEKCENCSIFSKLDIYWSLKILHVQDTFRKAP